jgi:predicted Rossmann-fold nucleotide-binding protein
VVGVTAEFFAVRANRWVDEEVRVRTWQERLFRLIELGDGFVACKGGTGTLVELAVVWEMLNKRVLRGKPFVVLGDFWQPVIERVREVEAPSRPSSEVAAASAASPWSEADNRLIHTAQEPGTAADFLNAKLRGAKP